MSHVISLLHNYGNLPRLAFIVYGIMPSFHFGKAAVVAPCKGLLGPNSVPFLTKATCWFRRSTSSIVLLVLKALASISF